MFTSPRVIEKGLCGAFVLIVTLFTALLCGCQSSAPPEIAAEHMVPTRIVIFAGDTLEITFPGAANLNGVRRVGPEGIITMPIVGQVQAAGKTVGELEVELERLYEKELNDKDVVVTLTGSANVIYLTGAVGRPGPVQMNRPLTALEAVLEAGGFAGDANMKEVQIIRYEGNQNTTYTLDLQAVFDGIQASPFYVKPRDVISVPRKFQWF